jgi:hypothetical protein
MNLARLYKNVTSDKSVRTIYVYQIFPSYFAKYLVHTEFGWENLTGW